MTFEPPMMNYIDTTINRPEHCRKPDCLMSVFEKPSDKCTPVLDVVNRNIYNRLCDKGFHCNNEGNCVKAQDLKQEDQANPYRLCHDEPGKRDSECVREFRNCKGVTVKNPMFGEYQNHLPICWGNVGKPNDYIRDKKEGKFNAENCRNGVEKQCL